MKLYKKKIVSFLLLTLAFSGILFFRLSLNPVPARAQFLERQEGFGSDGGITSIYEGASGEERDARDVLVIYIKYFLTFLGLIFTVLIIWSGTHWMMSNGNDEEIKKAKGRLVAAIIGMIIILSAYALTIFIYNFSVDALKNQL